MHITDLGREHPITAGIEDFDLVTEQYWVLHDDLIDVLAVTTHPTQAVAPVAPAGHLAGDLDPAVGCRAHRRDDPGAQPGRAGARRRPYRHREGDGVGDPHRVGVVGLGVISRAYLDTLADHPEVRIAAVADLDASRSAAVAATIPGAEALSVEHLLARPDVQTVLNLTIPAAHAEISLGAIDAGKNVYGEKPLAVTFAGRPLDHRAGRVGRRPRRAARRTPSWARVRRRRGRRSTPGSSDARCPRRPSWSRRGTSAGTPTPTSTTPPGGGPLLDMGPYYISALVHLLGPVRAVTGAASRLRAERVIGSGPRTGQRIPVEVDTHVTGVLEHANGALSTITTSFDGVPTTAAPIEVHGETGTLAVPDPNYFDGEVRLFALGGTEWRALEPRAGYAEAPGASV